MNKLVFITSRFPYPLNKGDMLRAYNQVKSLSEWHEVHLVSLSEEILTDEQIIALEPYCKSIHNFHYPKKQRILRLAGGVLKKLPFQVAYFYHPAIKKKIRSIIKKIDPDIIHCHLIRTTEYIKDIPAGSTISLDYMDCFSKGAEREAVYTSNLFKKAFLTLEAFLLKRYEKKVSEIFHSSCIISVPDKNAIGLTKKIPLKVVPNGVDFDIFYPIQVEKKYDLLFTGHMAYPPNISAARYAIEKIYPEIKKQIPGINLLVAGIHSPAVIKNKAHRQIHVIEKFDHIRTAFAESRIMLAPMNISIGLQNKILQAMAMKIPVICSSMANASILAPENECILVASTPQEYADYIYLLLHDKKMFEKISGQAYEFVRTHFNWQTVNRSLSEQFYAAG